MKMVKIEMFKAKKNTKRFRKNQKVWVIMNRANHLYIRHKWRGHGRYVYGVIKKWDSNFKNWNTVIGSDGLKEIEVPDDFANRLGVMD